MKFENLLFICFTVFTVTMAVVLFALDGYKTYLPYHTFEVAYGSAMSCREAIGGSKDLNCYQHVDKICQKVPQLTEFIANGRENN